MNLIEHIHDKYIYKRRINRLCENLARLIPKNARMLDVGCGDGLLASQIMEKRDDVSISGIDIVARKKTFIPVHIYVDNRFPFEDSSYDAVMFVDVLHHSDNPEHLLCEAKRVAKRTIIIKDHLVSGLFAKPRLRFMDDVGNLRHGVNLVYNYWTKKKWQQTIASLDMSIIKWKERLGIYPWPISTVFDGSLHFICELEIRSKDLSR
jgi:ubiquinone/menaquinone biosynthesis C-methylase UbiE